MIRVTKTVLAALTLALCLGAPVLAQTVPGPNAVPVARALQLFDAICAASAKSKFRRAKVAMQVNGVDIPSPWGTPTIYSATEDLSFQVGPQGSRTQCSMVFGTTDSAKAVARAIAARFGAMQEVGGMTATRDPRSGLVVLTNLPSKSGTHTIYHLALLTE